MARIKNTYSICQECVTEHYTDCCNCFGFGWYKKFKDGVPLPLLPEIAKQIREQKSKLLYLIRCPQCGSTYRGIPR